MRIYFLKDVPSIPDAPAVASDTLKTSHEAIRETLRFIWGAAKEPRIFLRLGRCYFIVLKRKPLPGPAGEYPGLWKRVLFGLASFNFRIAGMFMRLERFLREKAFNLR